MRIGLLGIYGLGLLDLGDSEVGLCYQTKKSKKELEIGHVN